MMNNDNFKAEVTLKNQRVKFEGISENNPERMVEFDYLKPIGDGEGFRGLELMLVTFGGCVSTTIVFLLRKMEKSIETFKLQLEGEKQENPLSLKKITFKVKIVSDNITNDEMQEVLRKAAVLSPVWNMVKGNVEVIGNVSIQRKEECLEMR
jgi:Predicted redox protein, regulator of disulfide bond formation